MAVGGIVAMRALARRKGIEYPDPLSFIIEPESEVPLDERILKLEGGINFRDIGGYRTVDGRVTRRGLVYRSGVLSRLTESDWERVAALGVRQICDLRSDEEIAEDPENLPGDIGYRHLPLTTENQSFARLRMLLFNRTAIPTLLPNAYTSVMIDNNPQVFGEVLRQIAAPDNLPMILHCTAGKDRTGVAVMLLLLVLGVPARVVAADYTLSNYYFEFFREVARVALKPVAPLGFKAEDLQPLLSAESKTVETVINHINQKYGSIETYLINHAGVSAETIDHLRDLLLTET